MTSKIPHVLLMLVSCLVGLSLGPLLQHEADGLETAPSVVVTEPNVQPPTPSITLDAGAHTPKSNDASDTNDQIGAPSFTSEVSVQNTGAEDWPMAGANPERTSWTAEEVRGQLQPVWYKPFEPYISQKVQIIAAYQTGNQH